MTLVETESDRMKQELGGNRMVRRAFGFDEIALSPGMQTVDPDDVDVSVTIAAHKFSIPIFGSAMDSVISPKTAALMSQLGGLGVLNLQGVQTRYPNAEEILDEIAGVSRESYVEFMQKIYTKSIEEDLISRRIREIKDLGGIAAVSATPQVADAYGKIAQDAGAEIFFVQSTVVSTHHKSKHQGEFNLAAFCKTMTIPVVVGNCVTYAVAKELMRTGVAAILVGIGPGAACTSRGVLGVGVPMGTAIADCAAARDDFERETGRRVAIIGDGGMSVGGDICKALACGADAVMIGSPLARAEEAPGRGFHWGMATPSPVLPRGTRIQVGRNGSLKTILQGPAKFDDGSQNLVGAIKTSMGTLGASTIREMQQVEVVVAPSILTEGKVFQKAQSLGMYK